MPSGGKHVIQSFSLIYEAILSHTLWGVDFFMFCATEIVRQRQRKPLPGRSPEDFEFSPDTTSKTISSTNTCGPKPSQPWSQPTHG